MGLSFAVSLQEGHPFTALEASHSLGERGGGGAGDKGQSLWKGGQQALGILYCAPSFTPLS